MATAAADPGVVLKKKKKMRHPYLHLESGRHGSGLRACSQHPGSQRGWEAVGGVCGRSGAPLMVGGCEEPILAHQMSDEPVLLYNAL